MSAPDCFIKRTGWPAGPWDDEPDEMQWTTRVGLPATVRRAWSGALCGYVDVPTSHPCHGLDYLDASLHGGRVHGGLTYSASLGDAWRFGFDAAHLGDVTPARRSYDDGMGSTYRDMGYMRAECESLARQLQGYVWALEVTP